MNGFLKGETRNSNNGGKTLLSVYIRRPNPWRVQMEQLLTRQKIWAEAVLPAFLAHCSWLAFGQRRSPGFALVWRAFLGINVAVAEFRQIGVGVGAFLQFDVGVAAFSGFYVPVAETTTSTSIRR